MTLRIDDDVTTAAIDGVIRDASVEVYSYLGTLFDDATLAASEVVQLYATDIALWFLCARRNNPIPGTVQSRYDDAIQRLQAIRLGQMTLPDAAMSAGTAPSMSNQRVKMHPYPHVVTRDPTTGMVAPSYPQRRDVNDPLGGS